jgi:hypothetical protein
MALHTYEVTTYPTQQRTHGRSEKVEAARVELEGDWVSFYDSDGLVLRLPARTVERVQRVPPSR